MSKREKQIYKRGFIDATKIIFGLAGVTAMFITFLIKSGIYVF